MEKSIEEQYRKSFDDINEWKGFLQENGFVVLANVINNEKVDKYIHEIYKTLEILTNNKFDFTNEDSWSIGGSFPFMLHGGMIQNIGHAQFQWN
jgi:hypothetical protein